MQKTDMTQAVGGALAEMEQPKPIDFPWEVMRDFITTVASTGTNQYQLAMGEKMVEAGKMKTEDLAPLRQMVMEQSMALNNMNAIIESKLRAIEAKRSKLVLPPHLQ